MALISRFQQSSAFQQTLEKINAGESVVWDGAVGSSSVLLGASVLEETKRPLLALVTHVGQVERVAADFAFFTDAPVYTYPALNPQAFENNKEVYLAEDADFGARLRVLKALDKACFILAGIDEKSLLQAVDTAVEMNKNGDLGIPVPDYTDENVSDKVIKIIQSYTGVVNKMVWRKY